MRTSPASVSSNVHLGTNPHAETQNAIASKSGWYSLSNGQFMKTLALGDAGIPRLAVFHDQENVFARARSDSRLISFRVGSLQFCYFSNSFSDRSLRDRAVSPNITNGSIFSRGHTETYRSN